MITKDSFTIPTDTSQTHAIQDLICEKLEELGWGPRDVFGIRISIEEALVNAMKHGNELDSTKRVTFSYSVSPSMVRIEIGDQGVGFNLAEVPNCTKPENIDKPTGRGIMLMRSFMSSVEYNDTGNVVIMTKTPTPPDTLAKRARAATTLPSEH